MAHYIGKYNTDVSSFLLILSMFISFTRTLFFGRFFVNTLGQWISGVERKFISN